MPVAAAATHRRPPDRPRRARSRSRGPVRSVVIVSECPVEELDGARARLCRRDRASSSRASSFARARGGREPRYVGSTPEDGLASVGGSAARSSSAIPALLVEGKHPSRLRPRARVGDGRASPSSSPHGAARGGAHRRGRSDPRSREARRPGAARRVSPTSTRRRPGSPKVRSARTSRPRSATISEKRSAPGSSASTMRRPRRVSCPRRVCASSTRTGRRGAASRRHRSTRCSRAPPRASASRRRRRERLLAEGSLFDLGLAADAVRRRKHPHDVVTYIVDRNVNYTNVCTTSCRFCAFYRPVGHPEGYVLSREVLGKKLAGGRRRGRRADPPPGGLNPDLRIEWYEDLFRWIKKEYRLGLHALSPEEILFLAATRGPQRRARS